MNKFQNLSAFSVPRGFRNRSAIFTQVWWLVQALLFRPSPQFFYAWRVFLLRCFGAKIGQGVKIRQSARVTYPWKVEIGDNAWIGDRAELYSLEAIVIGADTCISQDSYICTGSHDMNSTDFRYKCEAIHIASEVWIAAGCFIGPGVRVGHGTVVGTRSVVLRSLEAESIYAGHPAKFIKKRSSNFALVSDEAAN